MDDLFSTILKALATVIIVYAMMIPLFKHHNVLNLIDGIFVVIGVLILLIFESTTNYMLFGIISGMLFIIYFIVKFLLFKPLNHWYFIFHVTKKDQLVLTNEIQNLIDETEIEVESRFANCPCLINLSIQDRTKNKSFFKKLDTLIKTKFNYHFGIRYGVFLLIFIILAIIWRY